MNKKQRDFTEVLFSVAMCFAAKVLIDDFTGLIAMLGIIHYNILEGKP